VEELKVAMLASLKAKHAREKKAAQKKIKALRAKGDDIGAANIDLNAAAVATFNKLEAALWIEDTVLSDGKYLKNWIFVPSPMANESIFSAFHPCSSTDFTHMHVKDGGVLCVRIVQDSNRHAKLVACMWNPLNETKENWRTMDEATKAYIPGFDSPTRRQVDIRSSEYFNTCVQLNNVP